MRACVHVCICVHVCGREEEEAGVGNERHGALSNSPPHLMGQLHHYLAHTLGPNRLREEEDRQVYQTKYEGGGGTHHYLAYTARVKGTERKRRKGRGQTNSSQYSTRRVIEPHTHTGPPGKFYSSSLSSTVK